MKQSINVVVVGGGYFANFHINAWLRLGKEKLDENTDIRLIAIVEPDIEKHASLQEKVSAYSADTVITDCLSNALAENSADIIDIATPPSTHAGLIMQALASRCPTVICQKPFCDTRDSAYELYKQIKDSSSTVIVHENFRFQPWYRTIKSELKENAIGTVLHATFRLRPGDGQGLDAYLERQPYFRDMERFLIHETGVHFIDVFRYLFGEPTALSAELQNLNPAINGEDAGHFVFYYEHGLRAHFDGNRLLDHAADNTRLTMGEMLIEGTQGSIALYGNGDLLMRRFGDAAWKPLTYSFTDNDFGGDCVYFTQKHIVNHLIHHTPLENQMQDYLRNLDLESLIYQASASQKKLECRV